jgi:hypothetical protein
MGIYSILQINKDGFVDMRSYGSRAEGEAAFIQEIQDRGIEPNDEIVEDGQIFLEDGTKIYLIET